MTYSTSSLTTGVDAITGSAGNDTINGVVQAAGATGSTTSPGDVVSGGAGTDTFNLSVAGDAGGAYTLQAVQLKDVENVLATNFDLNAAATTVDTSLMTGVEKVGLGSSSATGDTIFSGMTSIVDAQMSNGSADLTMTYAAGTSGTADVQNLALSAVTAGTFDAAGIETIAVTGSLTANKLTNITGSKLTKITVAGDQNFTMTGTSAVPTIDASANTGKTSLVVSAAAGAAGSTITLGSGDDTLDVGTSLNALDKIQGGEGTDTIKISAAGTINGGATSPSTSEFIQSGGFEVIDIASTNDAATLNVKDIAGVETVKTAANVRDVTFAGDAGAQAAAATISFVLNGTTYTSTADLSGNAAADAIAASDAVAATIDALTGFSAEADGTDTVTITRTSGEVIEIAVTDQVGAAATEAAYSDVTVSGITDQSVDVYSADKVTARLVDPSGTEDVLNVNLKTTSADKAVAQTVGTLDVADTIETLNLDATGMKTGIGAAAIQKTLTTLTADNSLTTLNITGSDKLTIGTITAGKLANINASTATGDVSVPSNSGANIAQTITMGSGNDTLVMGAQLSAADVIDMGGNSVASAATGALGSDVVTATGNQGTTVAAAALQISNAEAVQLSVGGAAASYIDGSNLKNVGEIAFSSTAGPMTFTNMPADTAIGLGIADAEGNATITYSLADATGTEDALSLNYSDTLNANSSNTLVTSGIEVLNVSAEKAGSNTSTLVNTNMTAATINVTGGVATNTLALGALNKATTSVQAGSGKGIVTFTQGNAVSMDVSAVGSVINNITLSTKADTVTLTGKLGSVTQIIDGGATTSAAAADTLNATLSATDTDFATLTGFEVINLTVPAATATGFDSAAEDTGLQGANVINILGGNSNSSFTVGTANFNDGRTALTPLSISSETFGGSIDLQFASDALDAFTTVTGGASTGDHVRTVIAAATGNTPTMSGVEQLTVTSTNADTDAAMSLAKVDGLTRLNATFTGAAADGMSISGLSAGVPVYVNSNVSADALTLALASSTGAEDALSVVVMGNTGTLDLNAAGIETLNLVTGLAGGTIDLAGVAPTTGSATTVNISGAAAFTLNAINTGINNINGAAMAGSLVVAAAQRDADAITITGGANDDTIAMENAADVLTGGSQAVGGADTLVVNYSAVLGGATVDLSADDQVVSMDGGPNTAVQSGFENVDLRAFSGFGSVVTGSDGANVITGTAGVDRISAGKGNDTIQVALTNDANTDQVNGGAGTDTLTMLAGDYVPAGDDNLTGVEVITSAVASVLNLSTQSEGLTITGAAGIQNITGGTGADTLTGGAAADNFNFDTGATGITVATADTITDFVTAVDTITTNFAAADTTENDDGAAADFAAVVVLAEANFAGTVGVGDDVYVSIDAFGSGDAYVFIDEDASDTLSAGDTVIILTGVNLVAEFDAATDIL